MEHKSKPNWWVAFAIVPLMIVAILVESQFKYAAGIHEVADCAIVIVSFGLMVGWMRSNEAALEEEEIAKEHWVFTEVTSGDEPWQFELPSDLMPERKHLPSAQPRSFADAEWPALDSIPNKGRYN